MNMYILRLAEHVLYCILCLLQVQYALADPILDTKASTNSSKDVSAISQSDPYFSNGPCYIKADSEADLNYIPCGNWGFGTFACCEVGSYCLEHGACYSNGNLTGYNL